MRSYLGTWLFRSGRRERLQSKSDLPTEFFYGLPELRESGWSINLLEDKDLEMAPPLKPSAFALNKFSRFFGNIPLGMTLGLFKKKIRENIPADSPIIATTNNMGLALGLAKTLGILQNPVIFMAMGLLPLNPSWWQKKCLEKILKGIKTVTISRVEQAHLRNLFPEISIEYLPFGVDTKFWKRFEGKAGEKKYILALGNDANRDWETLITAWNEGLPPLKIVTRLPVPQGPPNVEVIAGDWREQTLSDNKIKELYWGAQLVVIPLRETMQPAGQSVCLQAMACGCPVIMSNIRGLWNQNELKNGEHWRLVTPGQPLELRDAVIQLATDRELRESMILAASELVEHRYNTRHMAASWEQLLEE